MTSARCVRSCALVATLLLLALVVPAAAAEGGDLVLILDASGSMWGQIAGENKIVIARRSLGALIDGLDDGREVGLVAYGHRREGDCADIETVTPIGPLDKAALKTQVEALNPKGKTPITDAVKQALGLLEGRGGEAGGATVILVSDGLETCGGDPCAAVRLAKEEGGADMVLHVVGFDVGGEDVSSLECMAQAGGGLYLAADDAAGLSDALDTAVAMTEVPDSGISVKAIANGALHDASVHVSIADRGEEAGGGRTYADPSTNPRRIPLVPGRYDVRVRAVGVKGDVERRFEGVEVEDGEFTELMVDYSTGEIAVTVTRNGALSDATVNAHPASGGSRIAGGRTYTASTTNPRVLEITAGTYDVVVKSVEIESNPTHRFEGVAVEPGGRAELAHEFVSGTLKIGTVRGEKLVDATVRVIDKASGKEVGRSRTYTGERTNPSTFVLPPGSYTVGVREIRGDEREIEVTVGQGEEVARTVDFGAGG